MERTSEQPKSGGKPTTQASASGSETIAAQGAGPAVEPSDEEVEAWAERVRKRRQAWVDGPTEEEKHEWLRRERIRRMARMEFGREEPPGNGASGGYDHYGERSRIQQRYMRDLRLAAEGLGVMMVTFPFRALAELVATGQEWEEDTLRPAGRRWIPFYEDEM